MLFVQSSRDALGTPDEQRPIIKKLRAQPIFTLWQHLRGLGAGVRCLFRAEFALKA